MVIVHVVEPFASGVAVFVKLLAESLSEDQHIIIHGERQTISPASKVKKSFQTKNVRFIRWRSAQRNINPVKDVKALFELFTILKKLKRENSIDAVHLHSSKSGFLGRVACKFARINNVIYTPNGAPFLSTTKMLSTKVFALFEKVANVFGGKVVCCSKSEQRAYEKLGIQAITINNGVPMSDMAISRTLREKNKFRIANCARITDQKNPALFNEIASSLADVKQLEFVWIGDGEYRDILDSRNIVISGWVSEEEAHELLKTCDVFLSTSNFEGLSFSVLEALRSKKPVLLRNCVGNLDAVKKGINGDLFQNAKEAVYKIIQYFANQPMLEVMGNYSKSYCRSEFNLQSTSRLYRQLYSQK
jgi:glycosyltransferase involved in cell wall biosynthesis